MKKANRKRVPAKTIKRRKVANLKQPSSLILEIGCEELPFSSLTGAINRLEKIAAEKLASQRIAYKSLQVFGTPRRLILLVEGVAAKQQERQWEVQGPSKNVSFDPNNTPLAPVIGFAKSQGVSVGELFIKTTNKGEYVFANRFDRGEETSLVLPRLLPEVVGSIEFSKAMRWSADNFKFGRPIRWILAIFKDTVINFSVAGVQSSNFTFGHRVISNKPIKVLNVAHYLSVMKKNAVIIDPEIRKGMVIENINKVALSIKGDPVMSPELLELVNNLIEFPGVLKGDFDEKYRALPEPILISVMEEHQRYFPVREKATGQLMANFINVLDGPRKSAGGIRVGNNAVLEARLKDAQFFYDEDLKNNLEQKWVGLSRVTWHIKLGSMAEKSMRLEILASYIAQGWGAGLEDTKEIEKVAHLCKIDLMSNMVREFPKLQGVMGRIYAELQQVSQAKAIEEHYLPRYAGDKLPVTLAGSSLALADKIDQLVGFLGAGIEVSGSQDPFGLRRAASGVVLLLLDRPLQIKMADLIQKAYELFGSQLTQPITAVRSKIESLFKPRLEAVLDEKGVRYDLREAVLAGELTYLDGVINRALALSEWQKQSDFATLVVTLIRVLNILPKDKVVSARFNPEISSDKIEKDLYELLMRETINTLPFIKTRDFTNYKNHLENFCPLINKYFDKVMVMCDDPVRRENHLALMQQIKEYLQNLADFSKIVVDKQ